MEETQGPGVGPTGPAGVRPVAMPGARLVRTRVAAAQTGGAYSLFEVEVGPGGGEGPHVQHREDECLWVLEGSFEFLVEGTGTRSGPGSLVYVPRGVLHAYEDVGGGGGRLLAVHTPGGPPERFYEEVGRRALGPREIPALAAGYGIELCEVERSRERKPG